MPDFEVKKIDDDPRKIAAIDLREAAEKFVTKTFFSDQFASGVVSRLIVTGKDDVVYIVTLCPHLIVEIHDIVRRPPRCQRD